MPPILVEHRVNTLAHMHQVPPARGIEVDVRADGHELILAHDPFQPGERLEELLGEYHHALLILNVKCDGMEERLLALAERYGIHDLFLLDVANPSLVKLVRGGERRVAVRFSEYEPIEFALAFAGQAEWCWVDCFTRLPLDAATYAALKAHFKLCLVSPELQRHPRSLIKDFRAQLEAMPVDAVCTDFCEDWADV